MRKMEFKAPIHGAMLCDTAGTVSGGALITDVQVAAEPERKISINGSLAVYADGVYRAQTALNAYENTLIATDEESGESVRATVYRLYDSGRHYRLSVDDCIWFLQDIARSNYNSIFENPFLALYRDIHNAYETKVHLNIYYCCPENGGFALCEMPDRYKDEWASNSHWLRLSFHAFKNLPDRPYDRATYDEAFYDCEMVNREILRFAGEKTLSDYTTVHWCSGTAPACRAWRRCGYKSIQAEPSTIERGVFRDPIAYYMRDEDFLGAVAQYGYFKDIEEDIIFTTADVILNNRQMTAQNIPKHLSEVKAAYPMRNFMELLIHEQYFYKSYSSFLTDYRARIESAVKWCAENGYSPAFRGDILRR